MGNMNVPDGLKEVQIMPDPIYVTKPYLPPFREFVKEAARIWESNILTNNGPLHQELEQKLAEYLGVPYVVLFNNGTIALQTAMQCLRLSGEVITTPYSFVATSHSIMWNGLRPVFVDVDPVNCNLDWRLIEKSITPETSAIVAVHTYGFPCDTNKIQEIADAYNLKVIYDAAHAFGVQHQGRSLLLDGDLSVLSLHATKVFNTFEGGAVICKDVSTRNRLNYLKNFGFIDETRIAAVGTNGKMSEVNAALGLVQLRHIEECLAARKAVTHLYDDLLSSSPCSPLIQGRPDVHNYAYYPVLINGKESLRDEVFSALRAEGIYCRRYFYPLLSSLPIYRSLSSSTYPVAESIANRVLCLPIYPDLAQRDVVRISDRLLSALGDVV